MQPEHHGAASALFLLLALAGVHAGAGTESMTEAVTVSDSGPGWTLEFGVPPLPGELLWLRETVMEDLGEIGADFTTAAEEEHAEWGEDPSWFDWQLEGSLSVLPAPEGFLCATASWWSYTGGAHGNESMILYRYAGSGGEGGLPIWTAVSTEDLLADSLELVALSRMVVDTLAARLGSSTDPEWILEGAGPEWGNYSLLRPVPDSSGGLAGFSTCFPSYSVAPYSCGPQEVFIPVGLLRP